MSLGEREARIYIQGFWKTTSKRNLIRIYRTFFSRRRGWRFLSSTYKINLNVMYYGILIIRICQPFFTWRGAEGPGAPHSNKINLNVSQHSHKMRSWRSQSPRFKINSMCYNILTMWGAKHPGAPHLKEI